MAGLLGRLFALRRTRDEEPRETRIVHIGRTQAGVHVTPENALANAVVWACVRYLTQAVAQLPWRVMRELPNGGAERVATHPTDWVLHKRPNPEMGSFTWRETLLGWALRYGNGYAEIERDGAGRTLGLWPLHPERVRALRDGDGRLYYEVLNYGREPTILDPINMFHLRGFGDGPVGYNVIAYAAQSIGWAQATELFGASFFGEGMNPAGVVEVQGSLTPEGLKRLKAEFEALYKGPRKANRTAFLDAGMKWSRISTPPDEAQFIESRQHQVEEICRWFGVPPHKVMHLLRSTFSNIEHQAIEVVVDTVTPWVKRFEEEADYKLFGQNRAGLFTKMNLNGLLRGDSTARAAFYKAMREMGCFSVNDILALEDMNPIGPDGDKRIVNAAMTTLERVGEEPAGSGAASAGDAQPSEGERARGAPRVNGAAHGSRLLS